MNAFAEARLDAALDRIDLLLEAHAGDSVLIGTLRRTRGDLVALRQLLELEADLAESKTQPAPKLSWRHHVASRAFRTNQPSVTGSRPPSVCSSRASSVTVRPRSGGRARARGRARPPRGSRRRHGA